MTKIAFQGVAGAYSEEAVREYFGSAVDVLPCRSFEQMFVAVEDGNAEYAMLPVENAVAGSVTGAYELLMQRDLRINAEVILRVHHMLMAMPGVERDAIRRVRSHSQALAQCRRYLDRYGFKPEATFDTAGSARDLAASPEPDVAVIASGLAAELYGLQILDRGVVRQILVREGDVVEKGQILIRMDDTAYASRLGELRQPRPLVYSVES